MVATLGPAPGFRRHPQHRIEIRPAQGRWQASVGDDLLAESDTALLLDETRYDRVVYFPPDDVVPDRFVTSDTKTTCPFKGEARYLRSKTDADGDDIAWTYRVTYDEVAAIAGYVAFYADKVNVRGPVTE